MKIAQTYSHLNGEEYLMVHHKEILKEVFEVIESIDCEKFLTKESKEKTKAGKLLYSPKDLNAAFSDNLKAKNWQSSRYDYCVTTERKLMQELVPLSFEEQKMRFQSTQVEEMILSYKQTDFVKDQIAIEVQFGKYAFVAYDLFVKHLLFYSANIINVGIEILPTKLMCKDMSSGIGYFEGEVYNVLRHGRGNPPVPLLIIGVTP